MDAYFEVCLRDKNEYCPAITCDTFSTQNEAVEFAESLLKKNGEEYIVSIDLVEEDDDSHLFEARLDGGEVKWDWL